jgi:hypothetical protein
MSNHTTGTWKNQTMGGCENGRQILSGKLHLATCHYGYGIDVNEANANAALIAAAPELLDALKKLVGWYDCFQLKEGEADLPVIVKSRAAIAKAENTTC